MKKFPSQASHLCYLKSADILAYNPIAIFSGNKTAEFKKFAHKHRKALLIGYLAYDTAYELHNIKPQTKNDLKLPNIYFLAFDKWHQINKLPEPEATKHHGKNFTATMPKSYYKKAYKKIKNYITAGDIYQINFTHRLEAETSQSPRNLFLKIAQKNPADYLTYIEGDHFEILSASPESFIKIENGIIETRPVKGTRPRGTTAKQDEKLKKELIESQKEAAELNMITDLLRNDIGKISKPGTVKVEGHRLLQKCPTVWHTYSRITGEIATTPIEALISMLPGGSITGCPKKRAIEIIDELEPTTRGVYTGVIGYIMPQQTMEFSIAIRTIIKKGNKLYLQVGGGIVLDSEEEAEFQETLDKAKSFMDILTP